MDNINCSIDGAPDVPVQLALLVGLWGFASCASALSFNVIGP